jgi:hypothetical protein
MRRAHRLALMSSQPTWPTTQSSSRGLQTELTGHLGYAKGDPEDQLLPNSRNGFSETTACNEIGD